MNNNLMFDLETLLHAILNGGLEVGESLRKHCSDYEPQYDQEVDIVEEVDRLYEAVKTHNEECEDNV